MLAMLTLVTMMSTALDAHGADAARGSWTGSALLEPRRGHTATLLRDGRVLLVGGGACEDRAWPSGARSVEIFDPSSARSERLPELRVPRREHATILLKGGRAVVLGGASGATTPDGASATVEVFPLDRGHGGGTAAWTAGPNLQHARRAPAAIALADGRLMVVGGYDEHGAPLSSTEIWDGRSGEWTEGPPLLAARGGVHAHALPDGRVLVIGAGGETELFGPRAKGWRSLPRAPFAPLPNRPATLSSVALRDGSIVAVGARYDVSRGTTVYPIAVWSPRTDSWIERGAYFDSTGGVGTASLAGREVVYVDGERAVALSTSTWKWRTLEPTLSGLRGQTETTLADGRILVAGGQGRRCDRAEIMDPKGRAIGHWRAGLARGDVLAALADGGLLVKTAPADTQVWEPRTGQLGPAAKMSRDRRGFTATALADGRVLVAGGTDPSKEPPQVVTPKKQPERMSPDLLGSVELYAPASNRWTAGNDLLKPREGHIAALLRDGDVLVVGGDYLRYGPEPDVGGFSYHVSSECLDSVERWSHTTGTWHPAAKTSSMPCGQQMAVLGDGRVLLAGGPGGRAAVYDPGGNAWSDTTALREPREGHALVALGDGRALAVGGNRHIEGVRYEPALASAEVWTPTSGAWAAVGSLNAPKTHADGLLLGGGKVFVTGATRDGNATVPEVWDPATGRWTAVAAPDGRLDSTCRPWLLGDGCVLLCNRVWCPQ